ncbi:MAG: TrkA family potassium uptake protein [Arcanobacterium sp.]|nr:TrkA family potassium uptake protein [Arcanobacterium sp.]MDY5272846.1 TrkA family potassium uptake protein [Arcanobacterium sp.]
MHFVIMGCGRVGSSLAVNLVNRGHSVAIIDSNADAFRRLPENFSGQQVTGMGFDRDALTQAGIDQAAGFAAVSSGDNSNIIAARVVRDTFGVKNVVTRIYDSSRAGVYERLGIATVATVAWTADRMMRKLIALGPHVQYVDSAFKIALITADLDSSWYGHTIGDIEHATQARVAYIGRQAQPVIPSGSLIVQDGDEIHLCAASDRVMAIQKILNNPVKEDNL